MKTFVLKVSRKAETPFWEDLLGMFRKKVGSPGEKICVFQIQIHDPTEEVKLIRRPDDEGLELVTGDILAVNFATKKLVVMEPALRKTLGTYTMGYGKLGMKQIKKLAARPASRV